MKKNGAYLLYSDFSCPFCYALHERLHEMDLLDRCLWRGVQHAPHLPKPMKPWQGSLGADLRQEVAVVQRLTPDLPIALPPGKPNTKRAIERAADLLERDLTEGMKLIRAIYHAVWREGKDISAQTVLDELGGELPRTGSDESIVQLTGEWEAAWRQTGQAGVPLIVSPDEDLLIGCVPVEEVRRFFN